MKLKIEKDFSDKYTNAKYKVGQEIDFKEERAKELLADKRGLVSLAEEIESYGEEIEKPDNEEDIIPVAKPVEEEKPKRRSNKKA